jgi:hypothetical protein
MYSNRQSKGFHAISYREEVSLPSPFGSVLHLPLSLEHQNDGVDCDGRGDIDEPETLRSMRPLALEDTATM